MSPPTVVCWTCSEQNASIEIAFEQILIHNIQTTTIRNQIMLYQWLSNVYQWLIEWLKCFKNDINTGKVQLSFKRNTTKNSTQEFGISCLLYTIFVVVSEQSSLSDDDLILSFKNIFRFRIVQENDDSLHAFILFSFWHTLTDQLERKYRIVIQSKWQVAKMPDTNKMTIRY